MKGWTLKEVTEGWTLKEVTEGWTLKEVTAYTAICDGCGVDLLDGHEYACWVQPEGVEEAIAELDWCPRCRHALTETAVALREEEE